MTPMFRGHFIIEHPTRGVLRELDTDKQAGGSFSREGLRSDDDNAVYFTLQSALDARDKLKPQVRAACMIMQRTDTGWEQVG